MKQTPDSKNEALCRAILAAANANEEQKEAAVEAPFLYQRIRNEIAAEPRQADASSPGNKLRWWSLSWVWSSAAVALTMLMMVGVWFLQRQPSSSTLVVSAPLPTVLPAPKALPRVEVASQKATPKATTGSPRSPKVRAPRVRPSESMTGFLPLTYIADVTPVSGQLVRMEVSTTLLASMGFSIPPTNHQESITADVVIGDDGVARAIRFVPY